jgi:hydrogenase maturation protein HypF
MIERRHIEVEGLVQGVGFRPFVHQLATRLELRGLVRNDSSGVSIDVEGESAALEAFVRELTTAPPPLAAIDRVRFTAAPGNRAPLDATFRIAPSTASGADWRTSALVSPDVATCDACRGELFNPANRRYRYPFLTCSHCGPRLTIALGTPFDRARTTMHAFSMCEACQREYEDPNDRRFHAQTTACAECGPTLALVDPAAPLVRRLTGEAALASAVTRLLDGGIVAIKGLGGYHLACDATNERAVRRLRMRKGREAKPFAVMVGDFAAVRQLAEPTTEDEAVLGSRERPIVLVARRSAGAIAPAVAPGVAHVGVMLPYTPLHHLLLADARRPLVMTSGNRADEPIA